MCGIVAIVSDERPVQLDRIERALGAMARRGPDGRGSWRAPDGRTALGHARLAVRARGDEGAQPFASEDGTVVATVNGELYGLGPIRRELEAKGHRLRGKSDCEVIVHLYEELGDALVERLRGEVAFILVDRRRGRVLAARDRFGIKPLVYARAAGQWILGSSCRALFAAGLEARLDADALYVAASLQYLPWDRTLFAGVSALPPGHALVIERGELTQRAWHTPLRAADMAEARDPARGFVERFTQAVRDRLEAEVPIAFQLSGGVDSAAVLATAAREGTRPRAFSLSFPGRAEDEAERARETATHVGADLEIVSATPEALAEAWPQAACDGEGLAINAHLPAKWLLARAIARAGAAVVLTGEGADELFYGYPHLLCDAGIDVAGGDHETSLGRMLPDGPVDLPNVARRLGFTPTFLRAKACIGTRLAPLLRSELAADHAGIDPAAALLEGPLRGLRARLTPVDVAAGLWSRIAMSGYILRTLGDGMEMAHGVEGRLPFLDGAVVASVEPLPWSLKLSGGEDKHLLREAMRGVLPEAVRTRPKRPFMGPPLEGPLFEVAADAIAGARFASQPVFDPRRTSALLAQARAGDRALVRSLDPALWLVASLALIVEGLGVGA